MSDGLSFPKEKIKIVLLEGIHASAAESFEQSGYRNIALHPGSLPQEALFEALADARMLGIRSRTQLTEEVLNAAPKLMAVGCFCIGTNQVDLQAAARRGVPVFNAPHSNTRSVAELVIAEMVMLYRGLGDKNTAAHAGRWTKSAKNSHELRGKVLGIVGYGHIGSQVSILAEAFGLRVVYYDVEPKLSMGNAQQRATLEDVLSASDIVTLHVPASAQTQNMIGPEQLEAMKPGACLINASRGNVVQIDALTDALDSGHLLGAAVDVYPAEPKSNDERFESPLQGKSNVILTPHIGGSTMEAQQNIGVEVSRKLVQYSDMGSTIGAVNFPNISLSPHVSSHRLLHVHENQPGVLGQINSALARSQANILGQHLQTTNDIGYVVIDLDRKHSPDLLAQLRAVPGTISARVLY